MNEKKPEPTPEPKTHAPKPARTDESKQPATAGFLHGLSEQAHKQFLAFERRFGEGTSGATGL